MGQVETNSNFGDVDGVLDTILSSSRVGPASSSDHESMETDIPLIPQVEPEQAEKETEIATEEEVVSVTENKEDTPVVSEQAKQGNDEVEGAAISEIVSVKEAQTEEETALEPETKNEVIDILNTKNTSYSSDELDSESESDSGATSESGSESSSDSDDDSESQSESDSDSEEENEKPDNENEIDSDDEDGEEDIISGPIRSKNEVADESAPELPEDFKIDEATPLEYVGEITGLVEKSIIIKASTSGEFRILKEGSIMCFEDRTVIGPLFETFGRLQSPVYRIKFNKDEEFEKFKDKKGAKVYYAVSLSEFMLTESIKAIKGTDASNCNDEEIPEEEQEFSDDEKEAASKASKKKKNKSKNKAQKESVDLGSNIDERPAAKKQKLNNNNSANLEGRSSKEKITQPLPNHFKAQLTSLPSSRNNLPFSHDSLQPNSLPKTPQWNQLSQNQYTNPLVDYPSHQPHHSPNPQQQQQQQQQSQHPMQMQMQMPNMNMNAGMQQQSMNPNAQAMAFQFMQFLSQQNTPPQNYQSSNYPIFTGNSQFPGNYPVANTYPPAPHMPQQMPQQVPPQNQAQLLSQLTSMLAQQQQQQPQQQQQQQLNYNTNNHSQYHNNGSNAQDPEEEYEP